jgi:catechol 2,3-dioxygenase-like lactoylglutathione lyase family enzyme
MQYCCALFVVEDIAVSRQFYEEVLGQTVLYDFGENIRFHGGFALQQRDHYARMTGSGFGVQTRVFCNLLLFKRRIRE